MSEIADPTWTISDTPKAPGEEILLEGWHASFGAGGCLRAGGRVDAETARRTKQGMELKAYVGGVCKWSGPISATPLVYRGTAELAAEGWRSKAVKASGRLLYQSRDVSAWFNRSGPPVNSMESAEIQSSISTDRVEWRESAGAPAFNPQFASVGFWAPGTPGGITRVAFTHRATAAAVGSRFYEIYTTDSWPSDTGYTQVAPGVGESSSATNRDWSIALGSLNLGKSGLLVQRKYVGGASTYSEGYGLVYNLRIGGIAQTDTFTTSQVVTDILGRLGFDTSGVQSSGVNALPYDLKDGSWFSGLEYMAFLDDWPVVNIVPADDGTRRGIYQPWGEKVHTISLENAEPELNSLPLYNGVTVSYPSVGGFQAEVTIRPSDIGETDPLAGTDSDNILAINLSDAQPQPDATLATAQGQAVLARLLRPREEGSMVVPAVPEATLWDLKHGDHLNVSDWAPLEAHELPIDAVELRQGQPARISIYSPGSELGLAARHGLREARTIQNPDLPVIEILQEKEDEPIVHADCHTHSSKKTHHKEPLLPKGKKAYRHKHVHSHEKVKIARHKQEEEAEPC